MNFTRRSVLKSGAGAVTLGTLAGCLSDPLEGGSGEGGYAAFFALWDWANQIAGDEMEFENPVDTGEMGHGWEPDGNLAPEIAESEVFLYLDTPEFAWAQDVVADLERDYEGDVEVIDGLEGMGPYLIPFDGGEDESLPEPDHDHEFDPDEIARNRFDIYDLRSDEQLGYWHSTPDDDHWHGGVPDVPVDDSVPVGAVFWDHEERIVPLGPDEPFELDARLVEGAPEDILGIESHGDSAELVGLGTGETEIVFELRHEGEIVYDTDTAPMDVEVVEELDDDGADEFHDPHVWVDPVLAGQVVDTIADGLAKVDPDNADRYAANAEDYKDRLADVDRQFEELTANAERDVAVFVAHDSFQYVERRYDFRLHTPVGVAPDAAESLDDIGDMIEVVEEHDVETILYDPFEAPDDEELPSAARMLLGNSPATDAEPLSPAEGTTHEWAEQGWGWVEQMEEVNIPALEKALGVDD
ncbi:metal ABC transporter solute-binding protein, Zn/Mn family [Natrialbaceae archaeon AArc-T1-2]|uniref:metal ABC transporter solute-binding protein, Zn/Mn family n=1 Tax=Natrialbaceae archaeon AArc-T1-2 TaxID=3053904 RepID=UPI00255A9E83|nr:zinc ABC transporter substrate-binding protein [Natrialbaceae archaeon AArc-T1-2]WIV65941.1 zinc ABC transporter substrate-binding protein [Natrialbaceae archaeon AArc-T1-2]